MHFNHAGQNALLVGSYLGLRSLVTLLMLPTPDVAANLLLLLICCCCCQPTVAANLLLLLICCCC